MGRTHSSAISDEFPTMQTNIATARKRLLQHAFLDEDSDDPRVTRGFLGALRPFDGALHEENFHDVMDCLRTLADELGNAARLDRDLVAALWSLCHLGRTWGVEEGGMLRANGLISTAQVVQLESWIGQISYATLMLLGGSDVDTAFEHYDRGDWN